MPTPCATPAAVTQQHALGTRTSWTRIKAVAAGNGPLRFEWDPALEGIATQETALSLERLGARWQRSYTPEKYRDAYISILKYGEHGASRPRGSSGSLNFFPQGSRTTSAPSRTQMIEQKGIVMGGPDVMPEG